MSETETIVVCPEDEDINLVDTFTIIIGVLTVIGSIIGYFLQRDRDRKDAAEAKVKEDTDLDRMQVLCRVRTQLSVLIGPMHRLWKTQATIMMQYRRQSGMGFDDFQEVVTKRGRAYWTVMFREDFLLPFVEEPHSFEAVLYRNMVTMRLQPIYSRVRELVMDHMSDLADMPSQEDWLKLFTKEDITSPHNQSININVVFDTFAAWTLEYDDIVESWAEEDFRRMQPTTHVAWLICNNLVDLLYDTAKAKEARYNKHVIVHKNTIAKSLVDQIRDRDIQELHENENEAILHEKERESVVRTKNGNGNGKEQLASIGDEEPLPANTEDGSNSQREP